MGRQPRPLGEGFTYHVMARGNNRRPVFDDDLDRRSFLGRIEAIRKRRRWTVHAWCLMGNHFHLLVSTPQADLSHGMRDLLGHYARRYNHFNDRIGHLFSGRFRSVLVETDVQFLNTFRYVCHNPMRAGLASTASEGPWTSYATRELPRPPVTVDDRTVLAILHPMRPIAEQMLRDLVESPTVPARAGSPRPTLRTIMSVLGEEHGIRAATDLGYSRTEVAGVLGISRSAVSQRLRRGLSR